MRTLIELNHDYSDRLTEREFAAFLRLYLASGRKRDAEALERFGAKVIALRHHSDRFVVDAAADGFPPMYLAAQGIAARSDETPQEVRPEGQEPGPKDAPNPQEDS